MFFKYLILQIFNSLILFSNGNFENLDEDSVELYLFEEIKNLKRSLENVKTRLDMLYERPTTNIEERELTREKPQKVHTPMFDIRIDSWPKDCPSKPQPTTCAEAIECTRASGIYKITDNRYSKRTFMVYCDYYNYNGDFMYILSRRDGSENFNRSWNDYVQGFGSMPTEYWLGLESLYALTNFYGPQELIVHIENFSGQKKFARYDNFAIGSAKEKYKLKSLGLYSGTAGDSLSSDIDMKFSTYDNDNDNLNNYNCAVNEGGGFWYNKCGNANPTGIYRYGRSRDKIDPIYWESFGGFKYSHKTIIFMIRRQSANNLK